MKKVCVSCSGTMSTQNSDYYGSTDISLNYYKINVRVRKLDHTIEHHIPRVIQNSWQPLYA